LFAARLRFSRVTRIVSFSSHSGPASFPSAAEQLAKDTWTRPEMRLFF